MRAWWVLTVLALAGCTADDDTDRETDLRPTDDTDSDTDTDGDTDTDDSDTDDTDTDTDDTDPPLPTELVEVGLDAGLTHVQWVLGDKYRPPCRGPETHTGAVAVGDYDDDGFDDLFFTVLEEPSVLYHNEGDGTFKAVSADSGVDVQGWASAASWGDVNGDGRLDLVVSYINKDWLDLFINEGDGRFERQTTTWGLTAPEPGYIECPANWGMSFVDHDLDGDLDLFLASWGAPFANDFPVTHKTFFENDGGRFWDITTRSGLDVGERIWAFTPSWGDLNGDGLIDLAMTSDFLTNQLYLNQGDGTWAEVGEASKVTDVENGMGSVLIDFDEDGDLDWLITSIFEPRPEPEHRELWGVSGNRIYLNDGNAVFTDVSEELGLRDGRWAWGIAAFDVENDGDLDVGWTNGHYMGEAGDYLIVPYLDDPTTLFVRGDDGSFVDQAYDWGLRHTGQGRGYVPFDYDNDGDLDILIVGWGERPLLYRNDLPDTGHWLRVKARRSAGNRFGVGATVWVKRTPEDSPRRREIHANPTYLSQGPIEAHIGLGAHDGPIHEVRIVWPEGSETVLNDVAPDQVLTVSEQ